MIGAQWVYYKFLAGYLPQGIVLHYVIAPFVLGVICHSFLRTDRRKWLGLLTIPFIAPAVTVFLIGGDPAKPGLEWVLFVPISTSFLVGGLGALGIHKLFCRRDTRNDAHA